MNADDDADDEGAQGGNPNGDTKIVDDDFASTTMSLTYDDNGNLTDDGLFKFVYDAWNRLVAAKTRYTSSTTQVTIGAYAYDGATRRVSKVVTNQGVEVVANDGGNTTVHFYYGASSPRAPSADSDLTVPWRVVETRNVSLQTQWQYSWGSGYIDEIILADKQGDASGNDVDPDNTAGGETENLDHRYFYHQDRNWNVTALAAKRRHFAIQATRPVDQGIVLERIRFAASSCRMPHGSSSGAGLRLVRACCRRRCVDFRAALAKAGCRRPARERSLYSLHQLRQRLNIRPCKR